MYYLLEQPQFPPAAIATILPQILDTIRPGPGGSQILEIAGSNLTDLFALNGGHIHRLAVVGLWPSQQIPAHADASIKGIRHHVPIQTNDGCWTFSGDFWQQLKLGRVYTMDPTQPHGAVNWGDTIRLHLMIDVEG